MTLSSYVIPQDLASVLSAVLRAVWWKEALHWNNRCLEQDLQGGGWKGLLQGALSQGPLLSTWHMFECSGEYILLHCKSTMLLGSPALWAV